MPIFILLSTLTQQGIQTLKSNPERLRQVNQDVEELGCKVLHQWATLGEFDFVNVVEAPDIATVAKVSVALGCARLDEDRDAARARDRGLPAHARVADACGRIGAQVSAIRHTRVPARAVASAGGLLPFSPRVGGGSGWDRRVRARARSNTVQRGSRRSARVGQAAAAPPPRRSRRRAARSPTIRSRFARERAPAALAVEDTRERTASPPGRARPASRHRRAPLRSAARRRRGSRPAGGRPAARRRRAASGQRRSRRPRRPTRRAPTRRDRRAPRRRAAGRRCASRAPARRASRAAPTVAGTSSSDLTPDETTKACAWASCLQVGGDVRRGRPAAVDAAEAAGRHEADPGRGGDRERAADRRRTERVLRDGGREVARAELARGRVEAFELRLGQPDDDLAVEDADRRRHAAALAHCALGAQADLDAFARREAVCDQSRLERDDPRAVFRASRTSSAMRITASLQAAQQQRAAAARPSSDAADEEARRERVAGARRVDHLDVERRVVATVDASARRRRASPPSACRARRRAARSRSVAKTRSGATWCSRAQNASSTSVHVETSTDDLRAVPAGGACCGDRGRQRSARGASE